MVKLWSKNKTFPLRTIAEIPVMNRLDTFELQIKFEHWVKNFPHVSEIYEAGDLVICFDEKSLLVQAHMTDRQHMMWCLKYGTKLDGYFHQHYK